MHQLYDLGLNSQGNEPNSPSLVSDDKLMHCTIQNCIESGCKPPKSNLTGHYFRGTVSLRVREAH